MNRLPRIAITVGDAAGVGPEICLKYLAEGCLDTCMPLLFGDAGVLARVAAQLNLPSDLPVFGITDRRAWQQSSGPCIVDFQALNPAAITPGTSDAATGAASYAYFTAAIDAALDGAVDAIVTAPINKEALHAASVPFPGHTEILIDRTGAHRACMMLTSNEITCSLVTTHVGYAEVPSLLTTDRILETIELTAEAMQRIRGRTPRLAACGLNPHAGEGGLFGDQEEERLIAPAVNAARANGIDIIGPLPPDTAFIAARRSHVDAYVCMYHDQGLIPLKTLSFDLGVNVTLGLPIVRTSVDHGTANAIAWQGLAQHTSLAEAVKLAVCLAKTRPSS